MWAPAEGTGGAHTSPNLHRRPPSPAVGRPCRGPPQPTGVGLGPVIQLSDAWLNPCRVGERACGRSDWLIGAGSCRSATASKGAGDGIAAPALFRRGGRGTPFRTRRRAPAHQPAHPLPADPRPRAAPALPAVRADVEDGRAHRGRSRPARGGPVRAGAGRGALLPAGAAAGGEHSAQARRRRRVGRRADRAPARRVPRRPSGDPTRGRARPHRAAGRGAGHPPGRRRLRRHRHVRRGPADRGERAVLRADRRGPSCTAPAGGATRAHRLGPAGREVRLHAGH